MTALYTIQGSQLLVCMCGLPARGKTYIAQKGLPLPNNQPTNIDMQSHDI